MKVNAEKLLKTINGKWVNKACVMCGNSNWQLSDKTYELREFKDGDLVIGGTPILPVVPVVCMNCGNVVFVNPIVTKSIEEEVKE